MIARSNLSSFMDLRLDSSRVSSFGLPQRLICARYPARTFRRKAFHHRDTEAQSNNGPSSLLLAIASDFLCVSVSPWCDAFCDRTTPWLSSLASMAAGPRLHV